MRAIGATAELLFPNSYQAESGMMTGQVRSAANDEVIHPIYVVFGSDRRRAADKVQEITELVLAGADAQLSLSTYEGPTAELAEVLDGLRTLPFLSRRRLVVVKEADVFISRYRQELEKYLERPCPTGVLLLMAESFPGNTRLAKRVKQMGTVFACEPIKAQQLPGFLSDYAARCHRLRLGVEAACLLTELVGDDSGKLTQEIDKIATYLASPEGGSGEITPTNIEALVGNNRPYNVFTVIDAVTRGDVELALTRLGQMLSQDRDAQYTAVGAFAWHFRRIYNARLLLEQGFDERTIIKQVRIWSNADQFMRQVKQLRIEQIAAWLRNLMTIDLASKTGAGTVQVGLEKLVVQFCRERSRVA